MIEIINTNPVALANHSSSGIAIHFANASPLDKGGHRRVEGENAPASTFRAAFLRSIREEIESGTYETPQRLAGAVDRLLDVLA